MTPAQDRQPDDRGLDPADAAALRASVVLSLVMVLVEGGVGALIGSAALLADAVHFVADAAAPALVLTAIGWSPRERGTAKLMQAFAMALVGLAAVGEAVDRLVNGGSPAPKLMALVALAALAVNFYCASRLVGYRKGDPSRRGIWLSARNAITLNLLTLFAAALITVVNAGWPDAAVGAVIALINLWAAGRVFQAGMAERRALAN
jgi:cobalt-zinc-cadmium efflux system protein